MAQQPGRHQETNAQDSPLEIDGPDENTPNLTVSREAVGYIILKAREFDGKDVSTVSDDASDGPDDDMRSVLEDRPDDPVAQELSSFINAMSVDEQADLITLAWIGRGDGTRADWKELRDLAMTRQNDRTADYLMQIPLLGDYLAEGLAALGYDYADAIDDNFQN